MNLKTIRVREILRFLVGGGSAVVVDYVAYKLLLHYGVDRSVSKAFSYVLGAAVGFIINKFWTFESSKFSVGEIGRYVVLYICSAIANTLVNKFVLFILSLEFFAFLCATGVSTIMNFFGQKFFVFKK